MPPHVQVAGDHYLSLRLSAATHDALERLRIELAAQVPGMRVSLADAARVALQRSLGVDPEPPRREPPLRGTIRHRRKEPTR